MTRQLKSSFLLLLASLVLLPILAWGQQGDSRRGEALFVGSLAFQAGGAPCLACHGIAGHELGYAAGANYGPDLTALINDYGEEGVAAVLEDPSAFESMEAIFSERPLKVDEIADLTAFFASVADNESADIGADMTVHAFIVTGLFLLILGALGWRRFQGVRRPLVEEARLGKGGTA